MFSFSYVGYFANVKEPNLSYYLPIAKKRTNRFMPFTGNFLCFCCFDIISGSVYLRKANILTKNLVEKTTKIRRQVQINQCMHLPKSYHAGRGGTGSVYKRSKAILNSKVCLQVDRLPYQGQRTQFALISTHSWRGEEMDSYLSERYEPELTRKQFHLGFKPLELWTVSAAYTTAPFKRETKVVASEPHVILK